jgi:polar amino acid transport system substrate-binding protein
MAHLIARAPARLTTHARPLWRSFALLTATWISVGLAWTTRSAAQVADDMADGATLRVGVKAAPPFVIREVDGSWSGIAIELWMEVARELGRPYVLEERELDALLEGVERGELDAAIGALTVTPAREARLDFTHAFHSSGLGIAVPVRAGAPLSETFGRIFSAAFLQALGALGLVLLAAGALMWLCERRRNPEQFGGSAIRGLGEGFWWSAVTMTTVGYGDRAPQTPAGRAVALVWMFASVITISGFTAAIASTLTIGGLASGIRGPQDLGAFSVAGIENTTGAAYLARREIQGRSFPDTESALAALSRGEIDAVVHDAPILRYWVRERQSGELGVLPQVFEPQQYSIALPPGSPLREPATRAVLTAVSRDRWERTLRQYLGE